MRPSRLLLASVVGAQVAYPRVPPGRQVAATRGIVGLMLGASLADMAEQRGAARTAALAGSAAAVGFAAELAGVATGRPFGHYTYSGKLGPRVGGVPVLAAACWTMMARPSWVVAGRLTRRRGPRAVAAAGALTAWDVFLDPRMVREGYWSWPQGGRYEDVSATNFAGWLATGAVVFALWGVLDGDEPEGPGEDAALALYAWTWIGETVANVMFWRRPVVAGAGGVAMGAFALPALRRTAGPATLMRVVVVGAGAGGLACALRLAAAGHDVTVLEQGSAPGGKAGRVELTCGGETWRFDSGPSLLTMPWVLQELCADTGVAPIELVRVEPVTRYRFADGTQLELSADHLRSVAALEAWSPGTGPEWTHFLRICAAMWRASGPFLNGPAPWPPRRPAPGQPPPDPRDGLRVRPWHTVSSLAATLTADPRLRMVMERFATYAGADPRRAPAALVVAGYVEHAFGAWHVPGGLYEIVRALTARLGVLGGELRFDTPALGLMRAGRRVTGVRTPGGVVAADAVVWNGDAVALDRTVRGGEGRPARERSLSGLALMLALRGRTTGLVHHEIRFPADYGAELDDVFVTRRPVADPTLYVSASCATVASEAPADGENWFVLANAPSGVDADWEAQADRIVARLGVGDRVAARHVRSPADIERETGAVGGAIYGDAPHGRLATLRRPAARVTGVQNLFRVGGTVHPGGGLPLVMLGGRHVAREIGPA